MLEGNGSTPELRAALQRQDAPRVYPAVVSVGSAIPPGRLTNAEISERLGISEDWIVSRTGVHERPIAGPDDRLTEYAARAARRRWRAPGSEPADVDLVIVGTLTQDEIQPNAAPQVAYEMGATHAAAVDVGAACTAFLSGVSLAASQIESGRARNVVVVGADFVISRVANWDDKRSLPLFGDGAGAVVMTPSSGGFGAIGPIVLASDGSHAKTIVVGRETPLYMDGPEVYRHAVARMGESTTAAVAAGGTDARGHRPVRLPPGQRADHARARRPPRAGSGEGRGRDRQPGQLLGGDAAAGAGGGRARRATEARFPCAAGRVRRRLHLGRGRDRMGWRRDA